MLRWLFVILVLSGGALLRADDVGHEVARKHAKRGGGAYREVTSLYTEGRALIAGEVVEMKMWAERPNRLRVESSTGKRTITQIYDGRHEPVVFHSNLGAGRPVRMAAGERKDFIANADFDGPLVDFAAKGYSVDYAGEEKLGARPAKKLLVMSAQGDVFFLWVDNETSEVVKRGVFRMVNDQRAVIETFFGDFRSVGGSLQPHRIETKVGEKSLYLMLLSHMEANSPRVTPAQFAVPDGWPLLPVEFKGAPAAAATH